ncbi:MAG: isoprenylcysteine carboxylmethyltransferase family protein [Candidatus Accumulibacter sp.]|jgi:protein-S-isoprenylcysteine O-methyltransferase Ste14|nr:isoprenylcysteine carboxylmethyltransferase family protein [Accumulibacter sp.]
MFFEWVRTILILPGSVLVFFPALALYLADYRWEFSSIPLFTAGCVLLCVGLSLAAWTMWLFAKKGRGTAAPWTPPKYLVVEGPYRHVRNPMITSVLTLLIAEALLLNSWLPMGIFALFLGGNMLYFPFVEEKSLENRFGPDYLAYKREVPRWLPRIKPFEPASRGASGTDSPD